MALAACGGGDDDGGGTEQPPVDPAGTHNTYVISELKVPSSANEATQLGLDIDGNGQPDNALGGLLAALANQADLDLNGEVGDQIVSGGIVLLADLQATDLTNATGVGLQVFLGDADTADPAPCTDPEDITTCGKHLEGTGMFDVAMDYGALVSGNNVSGQFTGGPGEITIELALAEGATVPVRLVGARATAGVSATALSSGKLGGALHEDDVDQDLIPAVADLIGTLLAECDPTGDPCCPEGSTGEQILTFFDDDGDCTVTEEELKANSLISSTIGNPDLDLFDESGNFNPRSDGVKESLSLGIGFSAVSGEFAVP